MITLFSDILHLDAVTDILLLSRSGKLLYSSPSPTSAIGKIQVDGWSRLFGILREPQNASFVFDGGSCCTFQTALGFVVVLLRGDSGFDQVVDICTAFEEELIDVTVRKTLLTQMLFEVDDHCKLSVIDELEGMVDPEIGLHLVGLLKKHKEFAPEVRDELLRSICRLLGDCSAVEAITPLSTFINEYTSSGSGINAEVEREARVSLQQLEFAREQSDEENSNEENTRGDVQPSLIDSGDTHTDSEIVEDETGVSPHSSSTAHTVYIDQKTEVEQRIKGLLARGQKQEAVAIIMKYIEAAARQKMFDKAEKLRDTLIKIDSMMLQEIIRAAEIIEESKAASIDPDDLKTWSALAEILSTDEFTSLYHAMTRRHLRSGEIVIQQGTLLPQLLFINSGQVQMYTHVSGSEIPLKTVGEGEVIGGGTFFDASVWTVSVRSLGAELLVLSRKRMEKLAEKHPSLESRLLDFSATFLSANAIFQKMKRSRRRYERKSLAGRVAATLLDKDGGKTSVSFKGDLFDISRGGLSFCVRVSRKKNANLLFGRRIRVGIQTGKAAAKKDLFYDGKVVAVRGHHVVGNEYSLHIQFDRPLSHQELQQVLAQN